MKKQMKHLMALAAVFTLAGQAMAANTDDVALSVTVSNSVSVLLPTSTYDFEGVATGAQSVSTTPLPVNNNSGGIREDYSLSLIDVGGGWSAVATTPAANEYAIQAVFASTQPSHSDFVANDYIPEGSGSGVAASATVFAPDGGSAGAMGYDVDDLTGTVERTLWLRLQMPSSVSVSQSNPFATIWVSAAAG